MAFMRPHIYEGDYFKVDTSIGTEIVPADLVSGGRTASITLGALLDYLEGEPDDELDELVGIQHGWLGRMSAPGYTDCTEWCAFDSQHEAIVYFIEAYDDPCFSVLDVPTHFLSALINGDHSSLEREDEEELEAFLTRNPEANNITGTADESHFDGYQGVTQCICQWKLPT